MLGSFIYSLPNLYSNNPSKICFVITICSSVVSEILILGNDSKDSSTAGLNLSLTSSEIYILSTQTSCPSESWQLLGVTFSSITKNTAMFIFQYCSYSQNHLLSFYFLLYVMINDVESRDQRWDVPALTEPTG